MHRNVKDIIIGERCRKDMGDIEGLARSIEAIGLLHPVVIDKHNRVIAGQRRIRAHLFLGIVKIPVTVVDLDEIVRGEYAENAIRKNFGLKEVFAIYEAAGPLEIAAAKARMSAGGKGAQVAHPSRATSRVATFAGVGTRTLEKIIAVMTAARAEPDNELYAKLVEDMDRTGNANGPCLLPPARGGLSVLNERRVRDSARAV
jgi:ParB-like chromosome segregation protein Spo0J